MVNDSTNRWMIQPDSEWFNQMVNGSTRRWMDQWRSSGFNGRSNLFFHPIWGSTIDLQVYFLLNGFQLKLFSNSSPNILSSDMGIRARNVLKSILWNGEVNRRNISGSPSQLNKDMQTSYCGEAVEMLTMAEMQQQMADVNLELERRYNKVRKYKRLFAEERKKNTILMAELKEAHSKAYGDLEVRRACVLAEYRGRIFHLLFCFSFIHLCTEAEFQLTLKWLSASSVSFLIHRRLA